MIKNIRVFTVSENGEPQELAIPQVIQDIIDQYIDQDDAEQTNAQQEPVDTGNTPQATPSSAQAIKKATERPMEVQE